MPTQRRILALLIAAAIVRTGPANAESVSAIADCLGEQLETAAALAVDARSIQLGDGRVLKLAGIEPFDLYLAEAGKALPDLQTRLAEILSHGTVRFKLVAETSDRYGRLPAMVLAGGELIQEVMTREGLAVAFASGAPLPCFDRVLASEEAARRAQRGNWKNHSLPHASPSALATRIGRFAIFEGRVLSVGNRPGRSYLNFGRRWTEDVTVEIARRDREAFGGEAKLAALAGHRVRVRGFLEEKGGPMLVVNSPMQVEVLDPAKEMSGKSP